ncbi:MAG: response regulator transcription factor [Chloroflexota bacterium]
MNMQQQDTVTASVFDQPPRILIVDDEPNVRRVLEGMLRFKGYNPDNVGSGEEALHKLATAVPPYDLLILDLWIGTESGLQVLEAARKQDPDIVVIILTAYSSVDSAVESLRLGAFDYLLKPTTTESLCQRVIEGLRVRRQALQRRRLLAQVKDLHQTLNEMDANEEQLTASTAPGHLIRSGKLLIDRRHRHATLGDTLVDLTTAEFDLLLCLVDAAPYPLTSRQLVSRVLGYDCEDQEARETIKWHVHRLRRKIEPDPAHPRYIKTVRHQGYFWSNDDE